VVHVSPMKPTLKAPGTNLLTRKYDERRSNETFKFNLSRYTEGRTLAHVSHLQAGAYTRSLHSST